MTVVCALLYLLGIIASYVAWRRWYGGDSGGRLADAIAALFWPATLAVVLSARPPTEHRHG